jgi:hypothetical protein
VLAAGFDEVDVDGETIQVANAVGVAEIELVLELVDDPDAVLAYEQREGIFEAMVTRYSLAETADGTEVTARTEFVADVAVVGSVLDATVIQHQRRRELAAQLDWLEDECGESAA